MPRGSSPDLWKYRDVLGKARAEDGGRPQWVTPVWRQTARLRPNGALALFGTLSVVFIIATAVLSKDQKLADTASVATLIALGLTIYIFAWTLWSGERIKEDLDDIKARFEQTARESPPSVFEEPDEHDADVPAEYVEPPTGVIGEIVIKFGEYDYVRNDRIPLRVIRDLVVGWEADGREGTWLLGDLSGAIRKTGRGNHSWFCVFADRGVLWKVSRGGKGKADPTVTEIHMPRRPANRATSG